MVVPSSAAHWPEENAMFGGTENPLLPSQPDAVDVPPDGCGCQPWPSVAKADQPLTAKHTPATRAEHVVFPEDFHQGTTSGEWHGIHNNGGKRPKFDAKHRVLGHFGHLCRQADQRSQLTATGTRSVRSVRDDAERRHEVARRVGRSVTLPLRNRFPQAPCGPAEKTALILPRPRRSIRTERVAV